MAFKLFRHGRFLGFFYASSFSDIYLATLKSDKKGANARVWASEDGRKDPIFRFPWSEEEELEEPGAL